MFDQCWANVVDGGPTLVKYWVDVSRDPSAIIGVRVRSPSDYENELSLDFNLNDQP